jgi:hypothetical protein
MATLAPGASSTAAAAAYSRRTVAAVDAYDAVLARVAGGARNDGAVAAELKPPRGRAAWMRLGSDGTLSGLVREFTSHEGH